MAFQSDDVYDSTYETDEFLAELPLELIITTVSEQINDPYNNSVNYLNTVIDKCNIFVEDNDEPEVVSKVDAALSEFMAKILNMINEKFDLGLDIDSLSDSTEIISIGLSCYRYFIIGYGSNISNYVFNTIWNNKKAIADAFSTEPSKDVSTLAYKKTVKNKDDLILITRLPDIIKYVYDEMEADQESFVDLASEPDDYDASVMKNLIINGQMVGNFVYNYIRGDNVESELYMGVRSMLFDKLEI